MARRRAHREQPFGFDAFVDLVTNLVGVVLRLILIVMMGAHLHGLYRSQPALEAPVAEAQDVEPPEAEALRGEIDASQAELVQLQKRLFETMQALGLAEKDVQKLTSVQRERTGRNLKGESVPSAESKGNAEALTLARLAGERRSLQ